MKPFLKRAGPIIGWSLFIVSCLMGWSSILMARGACGQHADIVRRLAAGYSEAQSAAGIAANGNLVEVFVSKKGGWTIISTVPGGKTCLMAVGENWERVADPFKESGEGT